jgi:hypothetical protein
MLAAVLRASPQRTTAQRFSSVLGMLSSLKVKVLRPLRRLRPSRGGLTAEQKSAEGVVGHDVGKATEALRGRKAEKRIGGAGNEGLKA